MVDYRLGPLKLTDILRLCSPQTPFSQIFFMLDLPKYSLSPCRARKTCYLLSSGGMTLTRLLWLICRTQTRMTVFGRVENTVTSSIVTYLAFALQASNLGITFYVI